MPVLHNMPSCKMFYRHTEDLFQGFDKTHQNCSKNIPVLHNVQSCKMFCILKIFSGFWQDKTHQNCFKMYHLAKGSAGNISFSGLGDAALIITQESLQKYPSFTQCAILQIFSQATYHLKDFKDWSRVLKKHTRFASKISQFCIICHFAKCYIYCTDTIRSYIIDVLWNSD